VNILQISEEIRRGIKDNNIEVSILSKETAEDLNTRIKKRYCQNGGSCFLWERLSDYDSISDINGWIRITEFVGKRKCIMFLDERESFEYYEFNNGQDLKTLLCDTYGFEFYITNATADYLICFNHHDYLIGCGSARAWVRKQKQVSSNG